MIAESSKSRCRVLDIIFKAGVNVSVFRSIAGVSGVFSEVLHGLRSTFTLVLYSIRIWLGNEALALVMPCNAVRYGIRTTEYRMIRQSRRPSCCKTSSLFPRLILAHGTVHSCHSLLDLLLRCIHGRLFVLYPQYCRGPVTV